MSTLTNPLKFPKTCLVASLLILVGVSCIPSVASPTLPPVIQTVEVTREVTRPVTQEVTRLVEVPVTVTPTQTSIYTLTPSLSPTISLTPTITPTPEPPMVSILEHADCLYGPGPVYLTKIELPADIQMEVTGRNEDGSWIYIESLNSWNPCWIQSTQVKFDTGDIRDIPIVWTVLPYSAFYQPPTIVSAHRVGNEVTIFWQAVSVASDDYRGYLIETWVCQGGAQVFLPIGYVKSPDQNTGVLSVRLTDESGCDTPSSARIYTVDKHGYSNWRKIPWPQFAPMPTSTTAPTSTATP